MIESIIPEPIFKPLRAFSDSRGYSFFNIFEDLDKGQVNIGNLNASSVKAFHYHTKQKDYWFPTKGDIHVICWAPKSWDLYLEEKISLEQVKIKHFYFGEHNPGILIIPELWCHGYQNVGCDQSTLLYWVTQPYNPKDPDEYRYPWNIFGEDLWKPENK